MHLAVQVSHKMSTICHIDNGQYDNTTMVSLIHLFHLHHILHIAARSSGFLNSMKIQCSIKFNLIYMIPLLPLSFMPHISPLPALPFLPRVLHLLHPPFPPPLSRPLQRDSGWLGSQISSSIALKSPTVVVAAFPIAAGRLWREQNRESGRNRPLPLP